MKNQADSLIFQTEKQMKDLADKMDAADKAELDAALDSLRKAQTGGNVDEMKKAMEALNASWQKISTKLYQAGAQAQPGPEPASAPNEKGGKDNVQDADFEVVDDNKK